MKQPFRKGSALMLSLPGLGLIVAVFAVLGLWSAGELATSDRTIMLLIVCMLFFLIVITAITSSMVLVSAYRRSGAGLTRAAYGVVNVVMLIFALGTLAAVSIVAMVMLGNPG